jgi:hypothetical protein
VVQFKISSGPFLVDDVALSCQFFACKLNIARMNSTSLVAVPMTLGGQSWIHLQLSICRLNAFPIPTQDLLPTIFCPSAAVRNCIPFRFDITVAWQLKAAV